METTRYKRIPSAQYQTLILPPDTEPERASAYYAAQRAALDEEARRYRVIVAIIDEWLADEITDGQAIHAVNVAIGSAAE